MDESLFQVQTNAERDYHDEQLRRQIGTVDRRRQVSDEDEQPTQEFSFGEKLKIFCATCCCSKKKTFVMKEYERAVIFRLGRVMKGGARGPGTINVYEDIDKVKKIVDLRETTYLSKPLILETRDGVFIEVLAFCLYLIIHPVKVINIEGDDPSQFIQDASMAFLRDAVINLKLYDVLKDKEKVEMHLKQNLEMQAAKMGVKVNCVELLSIKIFEKSQYKEAPSSMPVAAPVPSNVVPVRMVMYPPHPPQAPQFMPHHSFIQPQMVYTQQPHQSFGQPGMYPPMAYPVHYQ